MAFFSTTALGPRSPASRGRAAELARLLRLCQGEVTRYCVVYGGRQNGKTSLLFQLLAAVEHPMRVCRIDFQQIQGATPERVFALLAEQVDTVVPLGGDVAAITGAPRLKDGLNQAWRALRWGGSCCCWTSSARCRRPRARPSGMRCARSSTTGWCCRRYRRRDRSAASAGMRSRSVWRCS